ncbi:synapse-associated protein of 47 kDa [Halyomorpha halys]|uniref:synapse-associated protein of 47 kDa n=1 Tax=Halyomorpha halys TaxID=286706 RepID=UPI0006D4F929
MEVYTSIVYRETTKRVQDGSPSIISTLVIFCNATGGADSEAGGSEGSGTPIDDPGAQNFGAATTKALAGAKSLGNLLYSAVNKAGKTVSEASAKIKKTVEENSILGEFNKEQEAFIKDKNNKNGGAPVPPWVGCPNQEALREECLALSTDRRNFVRAPPEGVEFSFDMEREFSVCQAILQEDPNLEKMRFELVPKIINEENFWRNYLYRVNLICQAAEVSNMAESATVGSGPTETSAVGGLAETGFVSEEFPASSEDIKEVQEGMKKLGIKTDQESQEWEKELEAELQDYEMVGDKSIGNSDLIDSDIDDLK